MPFQLLGVISDIQCGDISTPALFLGGEGFQSMGHLSQNILYLFSLKLGLTANGSWLGTLAKLT